MFSDRIYQAKFDDDVDAEDCETAGAADPPDVGNGSAKFTFEDGGSGSLGFDQVQFQPESSGVGPVVPGEGGRGGTSPFVWAGVAGVAALVLRRVRPETFNAGVQTVQQTGTRVASAAPGVARTAGRAAGRAGGVLVRVASALAGLFSRWRQ